jgi:hypothetical protein
MSSASWTQLCQQGTKRNRETRILCHVQLIFKSTTGVERTKEHGAEEGGKAGFYEMSIEKKIPFQNPF